MTPFYYFGGMPLVLGVTLQSAPHLKSCGGTVNTATCRLARLMLSDLTASRDPKTIKPIKCPFIMEDPRERLKKNVHRELMRFAPDIYAVACLCCSKYFFGFDI